MKRRYLAGLAVAALLIASLPLLPGLLEAATTALTQDGHLLTIDIIVDQYDPELQGLVLYDESSSGTVSETIVSTWDPVVDQGPNIALNPLEGQPVLVWSRQEGADLEIAMVRRRPGGYWEPFQILTNNQSNDIEPRVIVDGGETAHILWWPAGIGGSVHLRSHDIHNGHAVGQTQKPFEGADPGKNKLNTSVTGGGSTGGQEDPGLVGGLNVRASADECPANPSAHPEHGVVMGCGRPAAYQLSACKLLIGVYNVDSSKWDLTVVDVTNVAISRTPVKDLVQSLVDLSCN